MRSLPDCLESYYSAPARYIQRVLVSHSVVAQRSYGHEKRCVCEFIELCRPDTGQIPVSTSLDCVTGPSLERRRCGRSNTNGASYLRWERVRGESLTPRIQNYPVRIHSEHL